jgi:hypothetical protein
MLTGCVESLSHEERGLFAQCLEKGTPIQRLLEAISEYLNPDQIPD